VGAFGLMLTATGVGIAIASRGHENRPQLLAISIFVAAIGTTLCILSALRKGQR
jgi:hypothetical protein